MFSEGLAAVRSEASWGFIDRMGKWSVQPRFADVGSFYDGLAFVEIAEGKRSGYIDRSGKLVIQAKCCIPAGSLLSDDLVKDGVVLAEDTSDLTHALFDHKGRTLVKGKGQAMLLGEGLVAYKAPRGLYGLMDAFGNIVQSPAFYDILPFSESLAAVSMTENGPWGFIDPKGKVIIPISFAFPPYFPLFPAMFHDGLSTVSINGRIGYIDHTGNLVIAPKFTGRR